MRGRVVDSVLLACARQTTDHPRRVVGILLLICIAAGVALPRFQVEPDISQLLPAGNELVLLGRTLESHTHSSRSLMVEVSGSGLEEQLPALVQSLRESPFLEVVTATREEFSAKSQWKSNFDQAPLYLLPDDVLEDLEDTLQNHRRTAIEQGRERFATDPVAGREVFLEDPLGLRWLIEAGLRRHFPLPLTPGSPYLLLEPGTRALLRVQGREVPYNLPFSRSLLEDLEQRIAAFQLTSHLYGDYAQAKADATRIRHDLLSSGLSSLFWVYIFLALTMRRWGDPLRVFIPVLLALFWTLPLGGALLGPLNALTISSVAILIGLGVDFTIHMMVRYSAERQQRHQHPAAIQETIGGIGKPLLASMLTTVAAFLSLSSSSLRGVRDFGLLLALGLALAFVSALFLLPLLLRRRSVPARSPRSSVVAAIEGLTHSRAGVPCALVILLASAAGLGLAASRGVRFSTELSSFRPTDETATHNKARFEEDLGFALMPVALLFEEDVGGPETARIVDELSELQVIGFHRGVWDHSLSRHGRIGNFREKTAGWLESTQTDLEAAGLNARPFEPGLQRIEARMSAQPKVGSPQWVTLDGRRYALVVCHPTRHIKSRAAWQEFQERVNATAGRPLLMFHVQALLSEMHTLFVRDLTRAAVVTSIIAALFVLALCGSWQAGLVALLPSACGFGLTLGLLVLTDMPLNMGNCVAIPFLLGLGVDQGLHLVAHFRAHGCQTTGPCGIAVWRSSVTTLIGFGSLMAATTPGIASLGILSLVGVGGSLLTSLLVLPVLWRVGTPKTR